MQEAEGNSLECAGPAALWPVVTVSRFLMVEGLAEERRQAAAGQSGARPPHSKELNFNRVGL